MVKKFEGGDLYQPAAQSQGFAPEQAPDFTSLLRENNQSRLQEAKAFADQRIRDQDLERKNLEYLELMENEEIESLTQFSDTLQDFVQARSEQYMKSQESYGLMRAYTEGLPEELLEAYETQKVADEALDGETIKAAAQADQEGATTDVSRMIRGMSHWERKGYFKGTLQQASARYPAIRAQIASNTSVTINGKEVTLDNAKGTAEYRAISAKVDQLFLEQFVGMDPALLNEHLFPAMKQYAQREAIAFADKEKKALEAEKNDRYETEVFDALAATGDVTKLPSIIEKYSPDFGGLGPTKKKTLALVKKMLVSRDITEANYNKLMSEDPAQCVQVTLKGNKKSQCFATAFRKDIGLENLDREFHVAQREAVNESMEKNKIEKADYINQMRESDEETGIVLTQDQLNRRIQEYQERFQTTEVPDYLKTRMTLETRDDNLSKAYLDQEYARKGYLTESDLANHSFTVRDHYRNQQKVVSEAADVSPPDDLDQQAKKEINGDTTFYFQSGGIKNLDGNYRRFENNAYNDYKLEYARLRRQNVSELDAHNEALKKVREKMAKTAKNPKSIYEEGFRDSSSPVAALKRYGEVSQQFKSNNLNIYVKNDALQPAIDELTNWRKSGGKGALPPIFHTLASDGIYTLSDGRMAGAWDIAQAQYKAHTDQELTKPIAVQMVDSFEYGSRDKLTNKPTYSRHYRSGIDMNWKPLMDLTGSVEGSDQFGGYDAMNTPYDNVGYNSVERLGRGVSTMTIGEVLALQQQDKVHAAGRYQFTNHMGTLEETMRWAGLTPDDPFNAANQDKLFKARYLWRMRRDASLSNLRLEWVGLNHIPSGELQAAVDLVGNPYNQPENLLPGLLK